jgi:hypothetical protein
MRREDAPPEPGGPASIQFALQAGEAEVADLPVAAGPVTVESAIVMLHELTLASDNGSVMLEGDWPLDWAAGTVTIALSDPRPGLYSRLTLELERPEDGMIPAAFQGQRLTARVSGKLASGAAFVVRIGSELKLDLMAAAPFDLGPTGRLRARVRFDLGMWFAGIDFPAGLDPVEIDTARNPDLLSRFRSNLLRSATLSFE